MLKRTLLIATAITLMGGFVAQAQRVGSSPEYVKALTGNWKGERFPDGRPKIPDIVLERLANCTLEQIWGYLGQKGYRNQVEKNWIILKPGETMTGRAVTAQFMPTRPDLDSLVRAEGKAEGRSQKGGINIWPIDVLTKGDIYVADGFGKIKDGTLIGSSWAMPFTAKPAKGSSFTGRCGICRNSRILRASTPG